MPTSHYSRQSSSASRCRASVSSGSSAGSFGSINGGHMRVGKAAKAGSSSFLVGRERDRSAEMELFR